MPSSERALNQHTTEFRKKASVIGNNVEDLGSITKELASDAVDLLQDKAGEYYDTGMKQAENLEKGIEKKIRENPLLSLLIAGSVGWIAGSFWNRNQ